MPRLFFNQAKAAQVAARLLKLRGAPMSYMKLIKLMYFIDREALLRWGRPVSTDRYVSMDEGPVLSKVYDLIKGAVQPVYSHPWSDLISKPTGDYEVCLLVDDPPNGELSPAEESLIDEIFAKHGYKSRWEVVDEGHKLPEWQDPDGSSIPIHYHDILGRSGKTELEIAAIDEELETLELSQFVLRPR